MRWGRVQAVATWTGCCVLSAGLGCSRLARSRSGAKRHTAALHYRPEVFEEEAGQDTLQDGLGYTAGPGGGQRERITLVLVSFQPVDRLQR